MPIPVPASVPTDGAFEDIAHVQLVTNLTKRHGPILVGHGAGSRYHPEPAHRRQPIDNLLGDAIGEVLVVGRAEILERQNDDSGQSLVDRAFTSPFEQRPRRKNDQQRDDGGDPNRENMRPLRFAV